jgi:GH25 family lysozyme M1 (1,4-beta-N-acetylmuramidase)
MSYAYGIDISRWQKNVDWARLAQQGVSFAFIKSTQADYLDPSFRQHWTNSIGYGIFRGAYHYYIEDVKPLKQAQTFVNALGDDIGELPPVVDVEKQPVKEPESYADNLHSYLLEVERCLNLRPIIYTARGFWDGVMRINGAFPSWAGSYKLWLANYIELPYKKKSILMPEHLASIADAASRGLYRPSSIPKSWTEWQFWQVSDKYCNECIYTTDSSGSIVPTAFDLDIFAGTIDQLRAIAKPVKQLKYVDITKFTNQKIMAAFMMAFGAPGGLILDNTGLLMQLYSAPTSLYTGPQIEEIPNLSYEQELALNSALTRQISNQKMINAFYAAFGAVDYWNVMVRAGLQDIANNRQDPYAGPSIDALPLTDAEKAALKAEFPV